ncbi:MAG: O-acetyl-ADP-ribose deacetylase [Candidatus Obscuribacterales bacterium]|jgi:O-acetyl-ADP-ribose deacetylase (regulator of RNase III)|nr:O-acetyl-ADP-ribose deacetylase [Candidatus Obscuribacterales bacterium]
MLIEGVKVLLLRGDITTQDADAIVNAANSSLLGGGGVDGAIHRKGGPAILEECMKIRAAQGSCAPGNAVITGGGKLAARWVVHTVGPVWRGGEANEDQTLANAYKNSLARAMEVDAKIVAFPSISTGAYGYPVDKAAAVAMNAIKEYLSRNQAVFSEIRFVLFDDRTFQAYEAAAKEL